MNKKLSKDFDINNTSINSGIKLLKENKNQNINSNIKKIKIALQN